MRHSTRVSKYQTKDGGINEEGVKWTRSIFKVVDEVIKEDVSYGNQVFVIGYGAKQSPVVFDLLKTLKNANIKNTKDTRSKDEKVKETLDDLEMNGAPNVRAWATVKKLSAVVTEEEVNLLSSILQTNEEFKQKFVSDCLPEVCRNESTAISTTRDVALSPFTSVGLCGLLPLLYGPVGVAIGAGIILSAQGTTKVTVDSKTKKSIRDSIEKGVTLAWEFYGASITHTAVFRVQEASDILHGHVEEEERLTEERIDALMKHVETFIYGVTPMVQALSGAKYIFSKPKYNEHNKVLFVLSDGVPTDFDGVLPDFCSLDVNVMSCYITSQDISDPHCLYNMERNEWEEGAKFMFNLSSSIQTQLLPRTIFVKQEWTLEIMNNRTKLFVQVNHPDLVDEVCSLARDVVCSQDALSDVLASVDLDLYINKTNERFGAQKQEGSTCYANASAVALHLAMKRIVGRDGGYPDFYSLRNEIIEKYGKHGANTLKVLQEICQKYRLHCQIVDTYGALKAVTAKRAVIAKFYLTDQEWTLFKNFYISNPKGILSVGELDISQRPAGAPLMGHAVILTSFSSDCLRFMNSYGTNWADSGFFRVRNSTVLKMEFIDVYWTKTDLKESERRAFKKKGQKIADEFITSLKGLSNSKFMCPLCSHVSGSKEFTGDLVKAKCPNLECRGEFNLKDNEAYALQLMMYLKSLCNNDKIKN